MKADLALFSGVLRRAWKSSDFMKTLLIGSLSSVVGMVKRHMRPISMIYVYTSGSGMAVEVRLLRELAFLCLTHGSIDVEDCNGRHNTILQDVFKIGHHSFRPAREQRPKLYTPFPPSLLQFSS